MPKLADKLRGRGVPSNPANRFLAVTRERSEDYDPSEDSAPRTQFIPDASASIITDNDSPDSGVGVVPPTGGDPVISN